MRTTRRNNYGYDLFDELFKDPFFTPAPANNTSSMMKTDIREQNGYYFLDIDLPGFAKENVRAELKDGYLTISADRSDTPEEQQAKGKYLRRERFVGTCKRSFFVGEDIRQEGGAPGVVDLPQQKYSEKCKAYKRGALVVELQVLGFVHVVFLRNELSRVHIRASAHSTLRLIYGQKSQYPPR